MLEIRKLTRDDMAAAAKQSEYAFGFWSDAVPSDEALGWRDPTDYLGGFVNGELVSKTAVLPFQQNVRGVLKSCGGVASVTTDPLHRRRGYSHQLIQAMFADMRDRGMLVSSLYPFLERFYTRYGYVTSNDHFWVSFKTSYLAPYEHFSHPSQGWGYEKMAAVDAEPQWRAYTEAIAPRYPGYVLRGKVQDYLWRRYLAKEQHLVFVVENGRRTAAARYKTEGNMSDGKLTIHELYWTTLTARDRLLGFFAMHAINLPDAVVCLPHGTNFQRWFHNPNDDFKVSVPYINMMCRVVDPVGATAGIGVGQNGRFAFCYRDPHCPWVDSSYALVAEDGALRLEKTTVSPRATLSVEGLSALLFGVRSVEEALHSGWAVGLNEVEIALLDAWFPPLLLFNPHKF